MAFQKFRKLYFHGISIGKPRCASCPNMRGGGTRESPSFFSNSLNASEGRRKGFVYLKNEKLPLPPLSPTTFFSFGGGRDCNFRRRFSAEFDGGTFLTYPSFSWCAGT